MTECYACAKLAELRAENNALHVKLDELERADVSQAVEDTAERVTNKGEMLCDSREKLEADVRWQMGHFFAWDENREEFVGYVLEWLDRQAAITERHILTHPDERDEQIAELQREVDRFTRENISLARMTDARIVSDPGSGQVCYIDGADYERLLLANENELWAMTERHGRLASYVGEKLWPRAKMTMAADLRAEFAEELCELGCEVDV